MRQTTVCAKLVLYLYAKFKSQGSHKPSEAHVKMCYETRKTQMKIKKKQLAFNTNLLEGSEHGKQSLQGKHCYLR